MAARFEIKGNAVLEINMAEFLKTGMIVSQTPLSEEFTATEPCENGMWVDANKANGEIKLCSADTEIYGIVYTAEKDFTGMHPELKAFSQVAGDYPRVGILHEGDTFTTNCFRYAGDIAAIKEALPSKLYVKQNNGEAAPEVTALKPEAGPYGQVVKAYTLPNGDPGIKYVIVKASK